MNLVEGVLGLRTHTYTHITQDTHLHTHHTQDTVAIIYSPQFVPVWPWDLREVKLHVAPAASALLQGAFVDAILRDSLRVSPSKRPRAEPSSAIEVVLCGQSQASDEAMQIDAPDPLIPIPSAKMMKEKAAFEANRPVIFQAVMKQNAPADLCANCAHDGCCGADRSTPMLHIDCPVCGTLCIACDDAMHRGDNALHARVGIVRSATHPALKIIRAVLLCPLDTLSLQGEIVHVLSGRALPGSIFKPACPEPNCCGTMTLKPFDAYIHKGTLFYVSATGRVDLHRGEKYQCNAPGCRAIRSAADPLLYCTKSTFVGSLATATVSYVFSTELLNTIGALQFR